MLTVVVISVVKRNKEIMISISVIQNIFKIVGSYTCLGSTKAIRKGVQETPMPLEEEGYPPGKRRDGYCWNKFILFQC